MNPGQAFLQVEKLAAGYTRRDGLSRRQTCIVKGVSFSIAKGRTLGMVGESGSGKTTLARSLLRLIEPDAGEVMLDGTNVFALSPKALRSERRHMQIIFQDADTALSPRRTVGQSLLEPLQVQSMGNPISRGEQLEHWLGAVGLDSGFAQRYPHELSTGQRQRVAIARAFILKPKLVVADEPVSALDANLRRQILDLIRDLQQRFDTTLLFISHDLGIVREISDEVAVMYEGRIIEHKTTHDLYSNPQQPYTRSLLKAAKLNRTDIPTSLDWHRQKPEIPG